MFKHGLQVIKQNDDVTPLLASCAVEENSNLFEASVTLSYSGDATHFLASCALN